LELWLEGWLVKKWEGSRLLLLVLLGVFWVQVCSVRLRIMCG